MAKKATAPKKAAKPVAKVAAKKPAAPVKKAPPAKPAAKATKAAPAKAAAPAKPAKAAAKADPVSKPALMTKKGSEKASEALNPKDQGDLLIEKAKEEMANINAAKVAAEKNAKIKPIKIERGNAADEKAKWQELFKRHGKDKAAAYKMTDSFDALKPLQHKVLGWGFVLSNENNRLEVLFENGIKMLISNYKAS
ncbi:hypothetical protein [Pseudobdellovibrio sp. HCB154]|uniref:hypothetical protein n=1 Tax=Pseudobdellovibrio sp. HCB154 TaxID=3386277 RepID=UPI00391701A3